MGTLETGPTDEVAGVRTPSGNASCMAWVPEEATSTQMRCSVEEMAGPDLPRPEGAECDWHGGRLFQLPRTGPGSRTSFCDALPAGPSYRDETLAYGSIWRHGPFTCLSSRLGLLCTNLEGHGLFLSREQQHAF